MFFSSRSTDDPKAWPITDRRLPRVRPTRRERCLATLDRIFTRVMWTFVGLSIVWALSQLLFLFREGV